MEVGIKIVSDTNNKNQKQTEADLSVDIYFPSSVYTIHKPEFLDSVSVVSEEYLQKQKEQKELDEIYPVYMTDNYFSDERIFEFCSYVGSTAWNILQEQGYNMENKLTGFSEMWTHEHHKHSAMERHVHGFGSQIVGFYFLETPENCSKVIFHDPRSGKVQIDLPEANIENVSIASQMVNYAPTPGMLIFSNAWLPHSFGRHASDKPLKVVHFNVVVHENNTPNILLSNAEII